MKSFLILCLALCISGCSMFTKFLPAKPKFPEPVQELTQPCPDLETIKGDQVAITELLKTVVNNYNLYYQCSLKNDGWNKWYKEQKEIYDNVK
jgi:hypothetical protein